MSKRRAPGFPMLIDESDLRDAMPEKSQRRKRKRIATPITHDRVLAVAHRFLHHSFEDIHFDYRGLTTTEKTFCTRAEFRALVRFIKTGDRRGA